MKAEQEKDISQGSGIMRYNGVKLSALKKISEGIASEEVAPGVVFVKAKNRVGKRLVAAEEFEDI